MTRFRRFGRDIAGVACLALALMTLLALAAPGWTGGLLAGWSGILRLWFGWGSYGFALAVGMGGLLWMRPPSEEGRRTPWGRIFALETAAFTALALLGLLGGISLERADAGFDGGRIGWALAYLLGLIFSPLGPLSRWLVGLLLVFVLVLIALPGLGLAKPLTAWLRKKSEGGFVPIDTLDDEPVVSVAPLSGDSAAREAVAQKKRSLLPPEFRKKLRIEPDDQVAEQRSLPARAEHLPPLELLVNELGSRPDERNINLTAGLIEKTLAEFGIPAKVVGFRVGPTVTQFAVQPGFLEKQGSEGEAARQKVRVAQISGLARDLALALSAERLRIEAPVPGRPYVGIEVPNSRSIVVRLRPILESEAFYRINSPLAIAFGRDVSGQPLVADLARMPHLLIAGTTGSGKSVCIAALTACLVMNNTPEDLRLVMIDPKMVELVRFNGLPHLFGKVETDLQRILGVLQWAVAEMDRRYKILEASHSRNLESYNRKARRRKGEELLPRIVVLIDELADLMMSAPEQTEPALVRLAQMARATGIHLVVATQRPSTDVITGLIKANFPARLSFATASSIDSRVILDATGAEALLGRGDMLFLPPEASGPVRCQGVMVTDHEVEKVITFWQKTSPQADATPPWEEMLSQKSILADRDGLVEQAIKIVQQSQRASASLLQRRLRIGYPRAARLIDELEEMGIIGPSQVGGRDREVLVERDEGDEDQDRRMEAEGWSEQDDSA